MIDGAHVVLYSEDAEADRAFLRDVLGLPHADAGGGWLIFGLPPSEVAMHPGRASKHELFLLCADVDVFVARMAERDVACEAVSEESWGRLTHFKLPGGGRIGVYQPKHGRAPSAGPRGPRRGSI